MSKKTSTIETIWHSNSLVKQEIHEMYDRHNRKISEIYFDSNKKKIKERREI